jgi:hypothetical protein
VWRRTALDSINLLERYRVRLLPDTVGLMTKPLPAWPGGEEFTFTGFNRFFRDTVGVQVRIDTSGNIRIRRMSGGNKQLRTSIRKAVSHLKFFPALDYQGQPQPYSGLISFISQGSVKIRIVCHWLHSGYWGGLQ